MDQLRQGPTLGGVGGFKQGRPLEKLLSPGSLFSLRDSRAVLERGGSLEVVAYFQLKMKVIRMFCAFILL